MWVTSSGLNNVMGFYSFPYEPMFYGFSVIAGVNRLLDFCPRCQTAELLIPIHSSCLRFTLYQCQTMNPLIQVRFNGILLRDPAKAFSFFWIQRSCCIETFRPWWLLEYIFSGLKSNRQIVQIRLLQFYVKKGGGLVGIDMLLTDEKIHPFLISTITFRFINLKVVVYESSFPLQAMYTHGPWIYQC